MRVSTKLPVAVHTMMIIAVLSDSHKINSDIISASTGVNVVIIRNIFTFYQHPYENCFVGSNIRSILKNHLDGAVNT